MAYGDDAFGWQACVSEMAILEIKAFFSFNPLMPGGNKKVTCTYTNLQLKAACLFKYV